MALLNEPVLNIIVVGFHHKKGCQVEHCYPELVPGRPSELPVAWRHLPALALPDGSHNYLSDTIFFNLPGLTEPAHTVYGISCFRQIPIEEWLWTGREQRGFDTAKQLSSDLTLVHYDLNKPLVFTCDSSEYGAGAILAHVMEDGHERPIAMGSRTLHSHERRYSQLDKETTAIMFCQVVQKTEDMTRSSVQKSVCIVCRAPLFGRLAVKMELVVRAWFLQGDFSQTKLLEDAFKHLNSCPVQIDQALEGLSVHRLVESWRHKAVLLFKLLLLRRKVLIYGSPAGPLSTALLSLVSLLPQCLEGGLTRSANVVLTRPLSPTPAIDCKNLDEKNTEDTNIEIESEKLVNGTCLVEELSPKETGNLLDEKDRVSRQSFDETTITDVVDRQEITAGRDKCHSIGEKYKPQKLSEAQQSPTMARDMSVDGLYNMTGQIDQTECGLPLPLFEDGYICLPYLSLNYLDLLSDPAVQGFVVGASNVLFKQKRQLFDVLVEVNEMRIETADLTLRRLLALSTEDLRFADHVVRHGSTQGDLWIRDQFATYLIYLLRTSLLPDGSRELDSFNAPFMAAFKNTPAYEQWLKNTNNGEIETFMKLAPVHPFSGQLSVADMKLKFAHTMSTTEGGRKVTAAVASTGRAVATTSRAVGGALSQARGALSGWWSALTAPPSGASDTSSIGEDRLPPSDAEDAVDQLDDDNKMKRPTTPDPPDKTIEDGTTNISNIRIV